jgi:hypothetical protein
MTEIGPSKNPGADKPWMVNNHKHCISTWRDLAIDLIKFYQKYDVSIQWLITREAAAVGPHLAQRSNRKLAIMPAISPCARKLFARGPLPPQPQPPAIA